jgi:hypothetical protein
MMGEGGDHQYSGHLYAMPASPRRASTRRPHRAVPRPWRECSISERRTYDR